jgi:hypothetical protein
MKFKIRAFAAAAIIAAGLAATGCAGNVATRVGNNAINATNPDYVSGNAGAATNRTSVNRTYNRTSRLARGERALRTTEPRVTRTSPARTPAQRTARNNVRNIGNIGNMGRGLTNSANSAYRGVRGNVSRVGNTGNTGTSYNQSSHGNVGNTGNTTNQVLRGNANARVGSITNGTGTANGNATSNYSNATSVHRQSLRGNVENRQSLHGGATTNQSLQNRNTANLRNQVGEYGRGLTNNIGRLTGRSSNLDNHANYSNSTTSSLNQSNVNHTVYREPMLDGGLMNNYASNNYAIDGVSENIVGNNFNNLDSFGGLRDYGNNSITARPQADGIRGLDRVDGRISRNTASANRPSYNSNSYNSMARTRTFVGNGINGYNGTTGHMANDITNGGPSFDRSANGGMIGSAYSNGDTTFNAAY